MSMPERFDLSLIVHQEAISTCSLSSIEGVLLNDWIEPRLHVGMPFPGLVGSLRRLNVSPEAPHLVKRKVCVASEGTESFSLASPA